MFTKTWQVATALKMWATATGERMDFHSVQFSPTHIFSPVDWTCKHYLIQSMQMEGNTLAYLSSSARGNLNLQQS